jgi:hypothetical protein
MIPRLVHARRGASSRTNTGAKTQWLNGPARIPIWSRDIAKHHTIRIEEIEQFTTDGRVRRRDVVVDVEAPTQWDIDTAETALRLLGDAIALARNDFPSGTAQ